MSAAGRWSQGAVQGGSPEQTRSSALGRKRRLANAAGRQKEAACLARGHAVAACLDRRGVCPHPGDTDPGLGGPAAGLQATRRGRRSDRRRAPRCRLLTRCWASAPLLPAPSAPGSGLSCGVGGQMSGWRDGMSGRSGPLAQIRRAAEVATPRGPAPPAQLRAAAPLRSQGSGVGSCGRAGPRHGAGLCQACPTCRRGLLLPSWLLPASRGGRPRCWGMERPQVRAFHEVLLAVLPLPSCASPALLVMLASTRLLSTAARPCRQVAGLLPACSPCRLITLLPPCPPAAGRQQRGGACWRRRGRRRPTPPTAP